MKVRQPPTCRTGPCSSRTIKKQSTQSESKNSCSDCHQAIGYKARCYACKNCNTYFCRDCAAIRSNAERSESRARGRQFALPREPRTSLWSEASSQTRGRAASRSSRGDPASGNAARGSEEDASGGTVSRQRRRTAPDLDFPMLPTQEDAAALDGEEDGDGPCANLEVHKGPWRSVEGAWVRTDHPSEHPSGGSAGRWQRSVSPGATPGASPGAA